MGKKGKDKKSSSRPAKSKNKNDQGKQQNQKKAAKPKVFIPPKKYTKPLADLFNNIYNPTSAYPELDFIEFQNDLRKLSKKSDVTKLKALESILARISQAQETSLFVDLMPTWVRLFALLIKTESDKRVREMTWTVFKIYAEKEKDALIEFSNELIVPMWNSQHDFAKEVNQLADQTFKLMFTDTSTLVADCYTDYLEFVRRVLGGEETEEIGQENADRCLASCIIGVGSMLEVSTRITDNDEILFYLNNFIGKDGPYDGPAIWEFCAPTNRPRVRAAALEAIYFYVTHSTEITQEDLVHIAKAVFSCIMEKNRHVQFMLWKKTVLTLLDKFPDAWDCIDVNLTVSSFLNLLRNAYPGQVIYNPLPKFISKLPRTLFDATFVENLFNCIFKGLKSEEAIGFSNMLIGAYYESLMFVTSRNRLQNNPELTAKLYLDPVKVYLSNYEVPAKSVYATVPEFLMSALRACEQSLANNQSRAYTRPPIWDDLNTLLSKYLLEDHHYSAIELLRVIAQGLCFAEYEISGEIKNIIDQHYSDLSHDIESLIYSDSSNILDKLRLFTQFSTKLGYHVGKERKACVKQWWKKLIDSERSDKHQLQEFISKILHVNPEHWLESVTYLQNFETIETMTMFSILMPGADVFHELRLTAKNEYFQNLLSEEITKHLCESDNLDYIALNSASIAKCKLLLSKETREKVRQKLIEHINSLELNEYGYQKVIHIAEILQGYMDEEATKALTRWLINDAIPQPDITSHLDSLWQYVFSLSAKLKLLAEDLLISDLKGYIANNETLADSYLYTGRQILKFVSSKYKLISELLFEREIFQKVIHTDVPMRFFTELAMTGGLNVTRLLLGEGELDNPDTGNLWVLAELLSVEYFASLTDLKMKEQLAIFLQSELIPLTLEITRSEKTHLITLLIEALISRAETHRLYSKVLFTLLKHCFYGTLDIPTGLTSTHLLELFKQTVLPTQTPWILAEMLKIYKTKLAGEQVWTDYFLGLRQRALENNTADNLWIYGAAMPEEAQSEVNELDSAIFSQLFDDRTPLPADCEFILAYVKCYGYENPRRIENAFIKLLGENPSEEELLSILPLVQRFLANPDQIYDRSAISDLVINIALVQSSSALLLFELGETIFRLYNVVDHSIDESSLFIILKSTPHISIQKAIYALLKFTYDNYLCTRIKSETGNALPQEAISFIEQIPAVTHVEGYEDLEGEHDIILPQGTCAFILTWLLLIHKYNTEKRHSEIMGTLADNEFIVSIQSYLEEKEDTSNIFLTSLIGYCPEKALSKTLLVKELEIEKISIFSERSASQLATYSFYTFMLTFPALSRVWWQNVDKRLSNLAVAYVKKVITPNIFAAEVENIDVRQVEWKESDLQIHATKNEILASFTKEEVNIHLTLKIPDCYPLRTIEISYSKDLKINESKVRRWFLNITQLLTKENSRILDAVLLWKSNVEKELEGIEECNICYYIVHATDKSLPNLPCKTCKNKFHAACIRKWFASSRKNVCPFCQNPWN